MKRNFSVLHKSKDLIEITTNQITKQQLKAFNYIAFQAKDGLQKTPQKREFYFSYSDIENMINSNKTNNKFIFNLLDKLRKTDVYLIRDSRNWASFSLLASVKRIEDKLQVGLSAPMCDCLLEKNYTTLNLEIIRNFTSKYTILFYEMYEKYKAINFPILAISDFKNFCGVKDKKTYKDFYNIKRQILAPALQELAEKEKIYLDYKLTKKGKSYNTIQFYIKENEDAFALDSSPMSEEETKRTFEKFKKEDENYKKLFPKK